MRKALSMLLALMLCISLAVPALAAPLPAGGECGEDVTWSIDSNGTLTISGTGPMDDWSPQNLGAVLPWEGYQVQILAIRVEEGVTTIGDGSFTGCMFPTEVTIPEGVTSIGDWAFAGCGGLLSVRLPVSLTAIWLGAFSECDNLQDIYYSGTESQWQQVEIDERANDVLSIARIHFNAVDDAAEGDSADAADTTPAAEPDADTTPEVDPGADAAPAADPNAVSVTVSGEAVVWTDAEPFIDENSRTMVPLRAVADAMGLEVNWDGEAREAAFTGGEKTIYFPIDSSTARTSDGETVEMDTAAVIVNSRTYAPIRYLAEFFGHEVSWDGETRTVVIA